MVQGVVIHAYEVRPANTNAASILSPMRCHSVGCGTARQTRRVKT